MKYQDIRSFLTTLTQPRNYALFMKLRPERFIVLDSKTWDWPDKGANLFAVYKLHNPIVDAKICFDEDTTCETAVGNVHHLTSLGNHFGYAFELINGDYHVGSNMLKVQRNPNNVKKYTNIQTLFSDNRLTMYGYSKSAALIVNHIDVWTDRGGYYGSKTKGKEKIDG